MSNTGDALYVEGNYDREVSVNIKNGTLSSTNGQAVQMLEVPAASGEKEIVITGGTFSSDIKEYIYKGLQAEDNGDGTYTVKKLENVYVNGISGSDDNSGADAQNAVKTLEHAMNLVSDDGVIYICGTVTVNSSLNIENVTIERADGYDNTLISLTGPGNELTLVNTVIDGKKSADTDEFGS